ncbi:3-dehydroquinate synthase [Pseudoalteromonas sp. P1-9]|uniref:3-dehydroquinate synthase n=1 Tax=Pseudoalteromonas sp. P1-9 TaxID=1710354 RepID=UPI0006D62E4F|nr:3-dehydroquinate synthase [Pseudoalteromonas sp. P1-9]KPV94144.1 3-dehydroquinate synthase [Pseudoalteromonas sp. P1-9]
MLELSVNLGERSYPIYIAQNNLTDSPNLSNILAGRKVVIVSNETIAPIYLDKFTSQLPNNDFLSCIIPDGEQFKSLEYFEFINRFLLEHNCGRDTCLIALGGGVIGDLTGFVAACYQRGIDFIQVPTTLLSQVDSSVGGKTAVNHPLGKNMIGAFYQPKAVYIDNNTLNTLPSREFAAGIAEVIKYGLIYDVDFFKYIEDNVAEIKAHNSEQLSQIIYRCCEIKAEIVAQDEKEAGLRALLNLGHTFGHAIEAEMGYGNWLHGEAVATGMVLASQLAYLKGKLSEAELKRIANLIAEFELPVSAPASMSCADFVKHMVKDKKNKQGVIRFIIPSKFGGCELVDDVTPQELEELFKLHAN